VTSTQRPRHQVDGFGKLFLELVHTLLARALHVCVRDKQTEHRKTEPDQRRARQGRHEQEHHERSAARRQQEDTHIHLHCRLLEHETDVSGEAGVLEDGVEATDGAQRFLGLQHLQPLGTGAAFARSEPFQHALFVAHDQQPVRDQDGHDDRHEHDESDGRDAQHASRSYCTG
jgi:hypothetical protein